MICMSTVPIDLHGYRDNVAAEFVLSYAQLVARSVLAKIDG